MWRQGTCTQRFFSRSAQVTPRCCSQPLQRVITNFGADVAFRQAAKKRQEHYGFTLSVERVRQIVEGHAQTMEEAQVLREEWPSESGVPWVVAETDGGMVPIVIPDSAQPDQRCGKSLAWKAAKLCLAHAVGRATPCYGGTLQGGVAGAGRAL